jgi:hypothetical protein
MKVKYLIEELKKYDPNEEIVHYDDAEETSHCPVDFVGKLQSIEYTEFEISGVYISACSRDHIEKKHKQAFDIAERHKKENNLE